jgi:hypothetical protein
MRKSLIAGAIFAAIFLTIRAVAPPPLASPDIQTLEQYNARLGTICQSLVKSQAFDICVDEVISSDEMATGSVRILAQQKQAAVDEQKAKSMADAELKSAITIGLEQGVARGFDRELSIRASTYLIEFSRRDLSDAKINNLLTALEQSNKIGSCWGIPPDKCKD